ncbi:hypothetical protein J7L67_02230 [bacterium]|nr:hypothetical protein [bacterium]
MANIVFYISGHGFGHSTRMKAVIDNLYEYYENINVFIRSNAPDWLFTDNKKVCFDNVKIDAGTFQYDFIHLDKEKSFIEYDKLMKLRNQLIREELLFVKDRKIDIVVGDIPPAAFYISQKANLPSVGISNFSWDWIFSPYLNEYPSYDYIIDDMKKGYGYCGLLLKLPFAGDFSAFKNVADIPLIVRRPKISPDTIRNRLNLTDEQRPIILCSFGGFKVKNFDMIKTFCQYDDFFFICFGTDFQRGKNYIRLPFRNEFDHPSLVKFADAVLSKLGYSTVAECVSTGTPLIYLPREDFAEFSMLEQGVKKLIPSYRISYGDFFSGCWGTHLISFTAKFFRKKKEIKCYHNGAHAACENIMKFC